MKHLRIYEGFGYKWKNIYEKDGELHIHLYKLISEMEDSVEDRSDLKKMEDEYVKLVINLLVGKVITFSTDDYYEDITDVCDNVSFYNSIGDLGPDNFQISFVQIGVEHLDEDFNINDDEVIVHLNIDSEMVRKTKKYNL